ncbi:MAG: hypothetical protein TQ35_0007920 [Candidatus Aramenus sulfurataquae]|jgi:uncharacterized membrane protein|nr:hypothetical protein [Candidatus Aramenus sulfurataquae]
MKKSYVILGFALMALSIFAVIYVYTGIKPITNVLNPNETFNFKVDQPSVVLFRDVAPVNFSFHNLTVIREGNDIVVQGYNGSIVVINNTTHPVTLKYTVIAENVSFGLDFALLIIIFVIGAGLVVIGAKR